jgi:hypothetical protein
VNWAVADQVIPSVSLALAVRVARAPAGRPCTLLPVHPANQPCIIADR